MKKSAFLTIICTLIITGCSTIKAVKLVQQGNIYSTHILTEKVPFELKSHAIIIKVQINDSAEKYNFILDTGAMNVIDKSLAEKLGLKTELEVNAKGSSGNSKIIQLVKTESINIGNAKVTDSPAAVFDMSEKFGSEIKGIIGSNFFRFFTVGIDYSQQIITISNNKEINISDEDLIFAFTTHFKNGFAPMLQCIINNKKSEAMLNTGTSDYIGISNSLAKKITTENNRIMSLGSMSGDLFGDSEGNYLTKIQNFKTGSFEINEFTAISYPSTNSDVVLGKRFLSQYEVIINYPAKRLILKPLNTEKRPVIKSYGIGLNKSNNKIYISGIWKNSSADRPEITTGTEVVKINEYSTENMSLLDAAELLYINEEPLILTLKNDSSLFKVTLRKNNISDFLIDLN